MALFSADQSRSENNLILAALSPQDSAALTAKCTDVSLPRKTVVHHSGDPITHVYLPGGGFFSELAELRSGEMIEVMTVGREGIAGAIAMLSDGPVHTTSMVQGEITACLRLPVADFLAEMSRQPPFATLVRRYVKAWLELTAQSTACNALHPAEQRLARWLLMAHDRMASDEFLLTQEFAAVMLGVSRPTVTIVAGILQKAGIVVYRHGRIRILNRQALESAACECYRVSISMLQEVFQTAQHRQEEMFDV